MDQAEVLIPRTRGSSEQYNGLLEDQTNNNLDRE
jgi:hypothetical protein